jgi:hypothetical protein
MVAATSPRSGTIKRQGRVGLLRICGDATLRELVAALLGMSFDQVTTEKMTSSGFA